MSANAAKAQMTAAPTIVPAIAPEERLAFPGGLRVGAFGLVPLKEFVGVADVLDFPDPVELVGLDVAVVEHVLLGPMPTRLWLCVAWLCQRLKVPESWLTER